MSTNLLSSVDTLMVRMTMLKGRSNDGAYIQTEHVMRNVPEAAYLTINKLMGELISYVMRTED